MDALAALREEAHIPPMDKEAIRDALTHLHTRLTDILAHEQRKTKLLDFASDSIASLVQLGKRTGHRGALQAIARARAHIEELLPKTKMLRF